jgi:hypothetical protein
VDVSSLATRSDAALRPERRQRCDKLTWVKEKLLLCRVPNRLGRSAAYASELHKTNELRGYNNIHWWASKHLLRTGERWVAADLRVPNASQETMSGFLLASAHGPTGTATQSHRGADRACLNLAVQDHFILWRRPSLFASSTSGIQH